MHHVPILLQNEPPAVEVSLPDGATLLKWNFYEDEDPKKYYRGEVVIEDSDRFYSGEVNISDLERLGQNEGPNEREINGTTYRKYRFKFPFDVRLGYHNVEFSYIDKNGVEVVQKTRLISAPQNATTGWALLRGRKLGACRRSCTNRLARTTSASATSAIWRIWGIFSAKTAPG